MFTKFELLMRLALRSMPFRLNNARRAASSRTRATGSVARAGVFNHNKSTPVMNKKQADSLRYVFQRLAKYPKMNAWKYTLGT